MVQNDNLKLLHVNWLLFPLLAPLALLFHLVTRFRNLGYDLNFFRSKSVPVPTLCVGNLRVGGTGKTPFVEYLLKQFVISNKQVCTLNRGYGRKTKGFIEANSVSYAEQIGDEAMQYFQKFGLNVKVFVGENRVKAIHDILLKYSNLDLVVLDDAFQHRSLKCQYNILLTELERPFYKDFLLPFGRLREARIGANRAQCVVVTKCPTILTESKRNECLKNISKYTQKNTPIFFTTISYSAPVSLFRPTKPIGKDTKVLLLSGIDNPIPFIEFCKSNYIVSEVVKFPDHHNFSFNDLQLVLEKSKKTDLVLTTEKDATRLEKFASLFEKTDICYLPIEINFLGEEEQFLSILKNLTN